MRSLRLLAVAALASAIVTPALAQSDVPDAHKFCWQENTGWLNWRDAGGGAQGVRFHGAFLSGFIWSENIGWINVGDGTPGTPAGYGNTVGEDTGVNIAANGDLFGLAWGENVGWINFDTRAALGASGQQARVDRAAGRLRGYAWGENIGWINLDDATHHISTGGCRADWNGDGSVNSSDISAFLTTWLGAVNAGTLDADFNEDGTVNSSDISAMLTAWLQAVNGGC
jgi:hypothetical protein